MTTDDRGPEPSRAPVPDSAMGTGSDEGEPGEDEDDSVPPIDPGELDDADPTELRAPREG